LPQEELVAAILAYGAMVRQENWYFLDIDAQILALIVTFFLKVASKIAIKVCPSKALNEVKTILPYV
jgi:hypothetical protein